MPQKRKKRLEWTARGIAHFEEIFEHIAAEDYQTALQVRRRLQAALDELTGHPLIGKPGMLQGTRHFVVPRTSHTIVYRVTAYAVQILRILRQQRGYFNR